MTNTQRTRARGVIYCFDPDASAKTLGFVNDYPEYGDITAKIIDLYHHITARALENAERDDST